MSRLRKSRVGERVNMLSCTSEKLENDIWLLCCLCDCGNIKYINQNHFRQIKSCGCVKAYSGANNHKTHGFSRTKEYKAWASMKKRCLNSSNRAYNNYGGRGIKICERWLVSFENFYEDMGKAYSKYHSLDRIDVNGDYTPENCRWATSKTQGNNRRNNIAIEMFGNTKNISQWCEEYQVSQQYIFHRVKKLGMTYEEAFTTPKGWLSERI